MFLKALRINDMKEVIRFKHFREINKIKKKYDNVEKRGYVHMSGIDKKILELCNFGWFSINIDESLLKFINFDDYDMLSLYTFDNIIDKINCKNIYCLNIILKKVDIEVYAQTTIHTIKIILNNVQLKNIKIRCHLLILFNHYVVNRHLEHLYSEKKKVFLRNYSEKLKKIFDIKNIDKRLDVRYIKVNLVDFN